MACRLELAVGADPASNPGSAGESVRCDVSGVEVASGSAECALLSYMRIDVSVRASYGFEKIKLNHTCIRLTPSANSP